MFSLWCALPCHGGVGDLRAKSEPAPPLDSMTPVEPTLCAGGARDAPARDAGVDGRPAPVHHDADVALEASPTPWTTAMTPTRIGMPGTSHAGTGPSSARGAVSFASVPGYCIVGIKRIDKLKHLMTRHCLEN